MPNYEKEIDEILNKLRARDFYDALQAIEQLGASKDFTASVVAVADKARKFGNQTSTRKDTHAQLLALLRRAENDGRIDELNKVDKVDDIDNEDDETVLALMEIHIGKRLRKLKALTRGGSDEN